MGTSRAHLYHCGACRKDADSGPFPGHRALGGLAPCRLRNGSVPWLLWFNGLSAGLRTKGSLVQFPVRAHAWVVGQVPSRGRMRGNHTLIFLSFSLPSSLSKNK